MVVKELVALLGIKTDDKGQKKAEGGLNKVITLAKLAVAAFAAIKAVKWLKGVVDEVAELGDRFDKMSKRTGIAIATFQGLDHAAELSGASVTSVETALKKLQKSQVEADEGLATYADEFKRMGVVVRDEQGNLKDTTDLFIEMADGIKNLDTDAERTAVAMSLLGRSGTQLIPMFMEGSAGIRDMMQEMKDLGGVMSDEMVANSAEYIDNQRRMDVAIMGVKNSIAKDLLPQINKLTSGFIKWFKANGQIIRQRIGTFFAKFGRVLLKNIKFFAGLLRTVVSFVNELSPLQKKIAGVGAAVTLLGALIMGGPIGKFLLLITILALLIEDFQTWKEGGRSAIGAIMKKFGEFLGMDLTYDQWISDIGLFADGASAIFSGLIGGAIEMFLALTDFLSGVFDNPEQAWKEFGQRMLLIWDESLDKIQSAFDVLGIDFDITLEGLMKTLARWIAVYETIWRNFVSTAGKLFDQIVPDWMKSGDTPQLPGGKPGPKLKGAGALIGGGGAVIPGAATSATNNRNSSKTDIQIDIQAAPGMSEEKLGWEVGRQVSKAVNKEYRAAARAITPEPAR